LAGVGEQFHCLLLFGIVACELDQVAQGQCSLQRDLLLPCQLVSQQKHQVPSRQLKGRDLEAVAQIATKPEGKQNERALNFTLSVKLLGSVNGLQRQQVRW
jgi:hypothetical protein